jgi:hypothetical protein
MSEIQSLADAIYSRFLLRDVFGKVVPGAIVLLAVVFAEWPFSRILLVSDNVSAAVWPLLYGAAWVAGFAVQQAAELLRISRTHDSRHFGAAGKRYHEHTSLARGQMRNDQDRQQLERFIVVKEATGNSSAALGLAPALWLVVSKFDLAALVTNWSLMVVWAATVYLLKRQHDRARKNEEQFLAFLLSPPPVRAGDAAPTAA